MYSPLTILGIVFFIRVCAQFYFNVNIKIYYTIEGCICCYYFYGKQTFKETMYSIYIDKPLNHNYITLLHRAIWLFQSS